MTELTFEQISDEFKRKTGKEIPDSTFKYYVKNALIPQPVRRPLLVEGESPRGVASFYPLGIVEKLIRIKVLLDQNKTIEEIRNEPEEKFAKDKEKAILEEIKELKNRADALTGLIKDTVKKGQYGQARGLIRSLIMEAQKLERNLA